MIKYLVCERLNAVVHWLKKKEENQVMQEHSFDGDCCFGDRTELLPPLHKIIAPKISVPKKSDPLT